MLSWVQSSKKASLYFCLFLIAIALVLGFWANSALDNRAYVQLRFAQNILHHSNWASDPAVWDVRAPWPSPLLVGLNVLAGGLGFDLESATVLWQSLGYALLALLLHLIGRRTDRPFLAWTLPIIMALHPAVFFELLLAQLDQPLIGLNWFVLSFPLAGWLTFATLLIAGLTVDYLISKQLAQGAAELGQFELVSNLSGLLVLPVLVLQLYLIAQDVQRPQTFAVAEQAVANWLAENSPSDAVVWGAPRVGFLADRAILHTRPIDNVDALPAFLGGVMVQPPDYFVVDGSLSWDYLTRIGWFAENYWPIQRVVLTADSRSQLTIWQQKEGAVQIEAASIEPTFFTDEGLGFVAGTLSTNQVEPGDAINMHIYWEVERPPTATLQTIVRLESPVGSELCGPSEICPSLAAYPAIGSKRRWFSRRRLC